MFGLDLTCLHLFFDVCRFCDQSIPYKTFLLQVSRVRRFSRSWYGGAEEDEEEDRGRLPCILIIIIIILIIIVIILIIVIIILIMMIIIIIIRLPSILMPQRESVSDGEGTEADEEEMRGGRKTSKAFRTIKIFNN